MTLIEMQKEYPNLKFSIREQIPDDILIIADGDMKVEISYIGMEVLNNLEFKARVLSPCISAIERNKAKKV